MYKEHLTAKDALASLREASPSACPNDGFLDQVGSLNVSLPSQGGRSGFNVPFNVQMLLVCRYTP